MSEDINQNPQPDESAESPVTEPESKEPEAAATPGEDESTIGTGTSMALGCIAGTIVLIGVGLLFFFISTFF